MFSSTTIASSMTMPTASVSASMVIEFSVKSSYQTRPNVAMIDVGIAIAAISIERQFHRNTSTTGAAPAADLLAGLQGPARARRDGLRARLDAPARDLRVLRLQRARDIGHREVLPLKTRGIQPQVDLALASAHHDDLADAADALELPAQRLVGVLGDIPDRLVRRDRERHYRRPV